MHRGVPIFDQRNQTVVYQYNATGDINVASVNKRGDLSRQLETLLAEVRKAADAKAMSQNQSTDVNYNIEKAGNELSEVRPDKSKISGYLIKAKEVIQDVSAVAGLAEAITQCADKVQHLF